MRKPKLFVFILLLLSLFLLFIALPSNTFKKFNIPLEPGRIHLNLGILQINKDYEYKLGLDLQGGTRLVYRVDMSNIPNDEKDNAFESVRSVIERRVNFFGVSEPTIQTLKIGEEYRVVTELPGVTNVEQATNLIGRTAQLTFWEENPDPKAATVSAEQLPMGLNFIYQNPKKTELTGKDLEKAQVVFGQQASAGPQVQITFTDGGSRLFGDITKRNIGKTVAIVLDDQVVSYPTVQQAIVNGDAVISGSFDTNTANQLAIQLNAGALPAPLELVAQSTIGPSLGINSLKASLFAGGIGFISVISFMVFLYRKEGLLASVALLIYTIIVLAVFKTGLFILPPVTLTLAGIAGFILSIGMAVDANILIFERMREELRAGKPRRVAVNLGFSRAWTSIRDSNVASIITSIILIYFGSGPVRGFAVTLLIGILVSMFSAIVVTRNLLKVFDK